MRLTSIFITSVATFISFFLLFLSSLQAQLYRGDKFIGGSANIYGAGQRETEEFIFPTPGSFVLNIQPLLGFVLNEKYALGAQAGVLVGLQRNRGTDYRVGFGAGIMGRRFFSLSARCLMTIHGNIHYQYILQDASSTRPRPSDFHEWQLGLRPAVIYFPTPAWGFEAGFGLVEMSTAISPNPASRDYRVFAGLGQIQFGIHYYVRR